MEISDYTAGYYHITLHRNRSLAAAAGFFDEGKTVGIKVLYFNVRFGDKE